MTERDSSNLESLRIELEQRLSEQNFKCEFAQKRADDAIVEVCQRNDSEEVMRIAGNLVYGAQAKVHGIWLTALIESGLIGAANFLKIWDLVEGKLALRREFYASILPNPEADREA